MVFFNLRLSLRSFLQNPDDKKGLIGRISKFINTHRKKSQSKQSGDGSSSTPSSPLSPHSPQSPLQEDWLRTPTAFRRDGEVSGHSPALISTDLSSSRDTLAADDDGRDLPFADSDSSGRGSVRELQICRVGTGDTEVPGSGNATPTPGKWPSILDTASGGEPGFADSVVQEVSKRLQRHLEEAPNLKDRERSDRTQPQVVQVHVHSKSHNLTSISVASKKTALKKIVDDPRAALKEVTPAPLSLTSSNSGSPAPSLQVHKAVLDVERTSSGSERTTPISVSSRSRSGIPSGQTAPPTGMRKNSPLGEREPGSVSPALIHKAIWVQAHLADDEEGERERGRGVEGERLSRGSRAFRADSPPLLAVHATVIPAEDLWSRGSGATDTTTTTHTPPHPSETAELHGMSPESKVSMAADSAEAQTKASPSPPEILHVRLDSSKSFARGSVDRSGEPQHVTRRTVTLPGKFFAKKVYVTQDSSEASEPEPEPTGKDPEREKTSVNSTQTRVDTAELNR